jgi:hypothetical protein
MTKLIVAFRSFANAPKNVELLAYCVMSKFYLQFVPFSIHYIKVFYCVFWAMPVVSMKCYSYCY